MVPPPKFRDASTGSAREAKETGPYAGPGDLITRRAAITKVGYRREMAIGEFGPMTAATSVERIEPLRKRCLSPFRKAIRRG
jgi:hypothetical protein